MERRDRYREGFRGLGRKVIKGFEEVVMRWRTRFESDEDVDGESRRGKRGERLSKAKDEDGM